MRIGILGLGLMGASLGLALRRQSAGPSVAGYDASADRAAVAIGRQCVHELAISPGDLVDGADLVVLAVPVGAIESALSAIAKDVDPRTVVTDLASTKRSVVAAAGRILPAGTLFVGSHPMVGSELSGAENARGDLYADGLAVLAIEPGTNAAAVGTVEQFWKGLGMRTCR